MTLPAVRERHAPPLCVPGEAVRRMRVAVVVEDLAVVDEGHEPNVVRAGPRCKGQALSLLYICGKGWWAGLDLNQRRI